MAAVVDPVLPPTKPVSATQSPAVAPPQLMLWEVVVAGTVKENALTRCRSQSRIGCRFRRECPAGV